MPELPEVQTVVDDLNKKIKGDTITSFWSDWPKAIKGKSLKEFQKEIKDRKILGARRIGKNIFIDLSGGKTLYIHLKMTGHLLVKEKNKASKYFKDKVNQYIHHVWQLESNPPAGGKTLEFSDVRKFAKIVLDDTEKIAMLKEVKKLGVDALSPEFTFQKFNELLDKRKHRPVGVVLMEQDLIAGIGNIYRSEIFFEAGIDPRHMAGKLTLAERKKVYEEIGKVLKKAVKYRGTSDSDYRDTAGAPGGFQKALKVYRRAGKKCPRCATMVKRSTLGQRSYFFCAKCQK